MALNILQVLPALNEGGVERGTLEIARYLVEHGHGSFVLSNGGSLVQSLENDGSTHIAGNIGAKSPLTLVWISRLRALFKRHRIDIVHARSRLPAWIVYLAWRGMPPKHRPRFVTTVHGLYSVNRYSQIMMESEAVIAVSKTIERYITGNYPHIDSRRIRLIFRGIDEAEFPHNYKPDKEWLAKWHNQFPELRKKFVVTLPGRLSRQKGHEEFLHIIARCAKSDLPIHGLVVGGLDRKSDYVKALRACAERHALPITFCGHRQDIREIYAVSDIVLSLAAKPESFGRTVLEPLNLGRPVIGYDHGGVGEILEEVFPAGRVTAHDVDAVVATIAEFYNNRPNIGVTQAFRLHDMQCKTLSLYEELTSQV